MKKKKSRLDGDVNLIPSVNVPLSFNKKGGKKVMPVINHSMRKVD